MSTRDRKDPPAPDENGDETETPRQRHDRKKHESENQDQALEETFPPAIRYRRSCRPKRRIEALDYPRTETRPKKRA